MTTEEKRKVVWSEVAVKNLKRIEKYIRRNFSPEIADRSVKEILARIYSLPQFPDSGRLTDLPNKFGTPTRYVLKRKTRIYYTHNADTVYVMLLSDTRQNPPKP
jgi:plasmid stabilization system protein ParE